MFITKHLECSISKEDSGSDQSWALLVVKGNKTIRNILCRKMAIDETEY